MRGASGKNRVEVIGVARQADDRRGVLPSQLPAMLPEDARTVQIRLCRSSFPFFLVAGGQECLGLLGFVDCLGRNRRTGLFE